MNSWPRKFLLALLYIYRIISPSLHFLSHSFGLACQCRFPISCSEFARMELSSNSSVLRSLGRILRRLWICSPWGSMFKTSSERF